MLQEGMRCRCSWGACFTSCCRMLTEDFRRVCVPDALCNLLRGCRHGQTGPPDQGGVRRGHEPSHAAFAAWLARCEGGGGGG